MTTPTVPATQTLAAVRVVADIAGAIQQLKEVPSGTLYTQVMSVLSHADYERILTLLQRSSLIEVTPQHLIRWIGPELGQRNNSMPEKTT